MSWPHCTKTHKLVRVLGNGPFPGQGPVGGAHGVSSPTQQYDFFAEQTLKISVYFMQRIKSYSIFTIRQTHRQTDAHFASLYARARFFSIWKFIPFTTLREWVSFALSLTSFVKDDIITVPANFLMGLLYLYILWLYLCTLLIAIKLYGSWSFYIFTVWPVL